MNLICQDFSEIISDLSPLINPERSFLKKKSFHLSEGFPAENVGWVPYGYSHLL